MSDSIYIYLGMPRHGWLPITFRYKDFQLDFDASDVLNNPVEELYNAAFRLENNDCRLITWWLEPAAYLFELERKGEAITLTITEQADLNRESSNKKVLLVVSGSDENILEPIRSTLRRFLPLKYDETDWGYDFEGR